MDPLVTDLHGCCCYCGDGGVVCHYWNEVVVKVGVTVRIILSWSRHAVTMFKTFNVFLYFIVISIREIKRCPTQTKILTSSSSNRSPQKSLVPTPTKITPPPQHQPNSNSHSTHPRSRPLAQVTVMSAICSNRSTSRYLLRLKYSLTCLSSSHSRRDREVHTESLTKRLERPQTTSDPIWLLRSSLSNRHLRRLEAHRPKVLRTRQTSLHSR